jgi:hypothetical protein
VAAAEIGEVIPLNRSAHDTDGRPALRGEHTFESHVAIRFAGPMIGPAASVLHHHDGTRHTLTSTMVHLAGWRHTNLFQGEELHR